MVRCFVRNKCSRPKLIVSQAKWIFHVCLRVCWYLLRSYNSETWFRELLMTLLGNWQTCETHVCVKIKSTYFTFPQFFLFCFHQRSPLAFHCLCFISRQVLIAPNVTHSPKIDFYFVILRSFFVATEFDLIFTFNTNFLWMHVISMKMKNKWIIRHYDNVKRKFLRPEIYDHGKSIILSYKKNNFTGVIRCRP